VVDPRSGQIIAGARDEAGGWLDTSRALRGDLSQTILGFMANTVIGVVATNARLTKEQANVVAMMATSGMARAIRPAFTLFDGDTLFVLATGEMPGNVTAIGDAASEVVAEAIMRAVNAATSLHGIPSAREVSR
jgi:L-aminopeptidase/D-esterase-like protein